VLLTGIPRYLILEFSIRPRVSCVVNQEIKFNEIFVNLTWPVVSILVL